jgi:hypothetical protein
MSPFSQVSFLDYKQVIHVNANDGNDTLFLGSVRC